MSVDQHRPQQQRSVRFALPNDIDDHDLARRTWKTPVSVQVLPEPTSTTSTSASAAKSILKGQQHVQSPTEVTKRVEEEEFPVPHDNVVIHMNHHDDDDDEARIVSKAAATTTTKSSNTNHVPAASTMYSLQEEHTPEEEAKNNEEHSPSPQHPPEPSVSFEDDLSSIGLRGEEDEEEEDHEVYRNHRVSSSFDGYEHEEDDEDVHSETSSTVDLSLANHSHASSSVNPLSAASTTSVLLSSSNTSVLWEYWSSATETVQSFVQEQQQQQSSSSPTVHVEKMLQTSSSFLETTANSTMLMESFNQSMEAANELVNTIWTTTNTTTKNTNGTTHNSTPPRQNPSSSTTKKKHASLCQPDVDLPLLAAPPLDSCLSSLSHNHKSNHHATDFVQDEDVREMTDLHLLLGEEEDAMDTTTTARESNNNHTKATEQSPLDSSSWAPSFDLYDLQDGEVVTKPIIAINNKPTTNTTTHTRSSSSSSSLSRADSPFDEPTTTVPEMTTLVLSRHNERQLTGLYSQAIHMTRVSSEPTKSAVKNNTEYNPFDSLRTPRRKKKELHHVPLPFWPSHVAITVQQQISTMKDEQAANSQYAPAVHDDDDEDNVLQQQLNQSVDSILNMTGGSEESSSSNTTSSSSSPASATFGGTTTSNSSSNRNNNNNDDTMNHQIWLERASSCNKIISHASIELVASRTVNDQHHAAARKSPLGSMVRSRLFRKADKFPTINNNGLASGDALAPAQQ